MRGVGGSSVLTQLVVANYELVEKTEIDLEPWTGSSRSMTARSRDPRARPSRCRRSVRSP